MGEKSSGWDAFVNPSVRGCGTPYPGLLEAQQHAITETMQEQYCFGLMMPPGINNAYKDVYIPGGKTAKAGMCRRSRTKEYNQWISASKKAMRDQSVAQAEKRDGNPKRNKDSNLWSIVIQTHLAAWTRDIDGVEKQLLDFLSDWFNLDDRYIIQIINNRFADDRDMGEDWKGMLHVRVTVFAPKEEVYSGSVLRRSE